MGEISKSGLRRGRGGNASPSLLYKILLVFGGERGSVRRRISGPTVRDPGVRERFRSFVLNTR